MNKRKYRVVIKELRRFGRLNEERDEEIEVKPLRVKSFSVDAFFSVFKASRSAPAAQPLH